MLLNPNSPLLGKWDIPLNSSINIFSLRPAGTEISRTILTKSLTTQTLKIITRSRPKPTDTDRSNRTHTLNTQVLQNTSKRCIRGQCRQTTLSATSFPTNCKTIWGRRWKPTGRAWRWIWICSIIKGPDFLDCEYLLGIIIIKLLHHGSRGCILQNTQENSASLENRQERVAEAAWRK